MAGTAALPAGFIGPPLVEPALYGQTWEGQVFSGLEPRPDIFESRDTVRWEGRDTLAGIWIAHPNAPPAIRARFLNPRTGRAADGALIQRPAATEPLISSEAAKILDIRPYRDTGIIIVAVDFPTIIAVRAEPAEPEQVDQSAPAEPEETALSSAEIADVIANAAPTATPPEAPDDAAGTADAAGDGEPEPLEGTTESTEALVDIAAVASEDAAFVWEAETPSESATPDPQPIAAAVTTDEDVVEPAPEAPSEPTVPSEETEETPGLLTLPSTAPAIAAPQDPEPAAEPEAAPPEPTETVIETVASPPSAESPAEAAADIDESPPRLRYLQAGVFGVEENARRVLRALTARGYEGQSIPVDLGTGPAFRVRAGPFASVSARNEAATILRNLGIRDAVPVVR
ncbi:MAG: SPOR domain-containing protein [Pseudomonadota bacterium]